jgi:hypothetical protein
LKIEKFCYQNEKRKKYPRCALRRKKKDKTKFIERKKNERKKSKISKTEVKHKVR